MNLKFKDEFLLKYGALFKTKRLDIFVKHVDTLNEVMKRKYNKRISIYWYIHFANKNDILLARHLQLDRSSKKSKSSFGIHFKTVMEKNHPFLSNDEKKSLYVSYAIIEHDTDHKYCDLYKIMKDFYLAFDKLEKHSQFGMKTLRFFKIVSEFTFENITKLSSALFAFLTFVLMLRLTSLPTSSIQFEALSFAIAYALLIIVIIAIFFGLILWFTMGLMIFFISIFNKKIQMKYELYISSEINTYAYLPAFVIILLLFIYTIYTTVFTNESDPFCDVALQTYLSDIQTPFYARMQFIDLNETKSRNVMFVDEKGQNTYFLLDDGLHRLIYRNEALIKSLCMGEEKKTYMDSILPMIYTKTFDHRMYQKTRSRYVQISSTTLPFQDTFCYIEFPKAIRLKSNGNVILLMGRPNPDYEKEKYFYYPLSKIEKKIVMNKEILDAADQNESFKAIMRSRALEKIPFDSIILKVDEYDVFDLNNYLACKRVVKKP